MPFRDASPNTVLDKRLLGKFLVALGATVSRASEVAGLYCKEKPKLGDRDKREFYEFALGFFKENVPWSHMAEALRLELTYGDDEPARETGEKAGA